MPFIHACSIMCGKKMHNNNWNTMYLRKRFFARISRFLLWKLCVRLLEENAYDASSLSFFVLRQATGVN